MNDEKKKPVIFIQPGPNFYQRNLYAQNLLLQAMGKGVTDPKDLAKAAGLRTVAEVYRNLDKLAIRKQYHKVLDEEGASLNKIVKGILDIAENGDSDATKLKAWTVIMKSVGLDSYQHVEQSANSWEETIMKAREAMKLEENPVIDADYEVVVPQTPDEEIEKRAKEDLSGKELYARD